MSPAPLPPSLFLHHLEALPHPLAPPPPTPNPLAPSAEVARGADVVSHEATFDRNMLDKARIAQHSTAGMAGAFGRQVGARNLFLTHFSSRYSGVMPPPRFGNHQNFRTPTAQVPPPPSAVMAATTAGRSACAPAFIHP